VGGLKIYLEVELMGDISNKVRRPGQKRKEGMNTMMELSGHPDQNPAREPYQALR
jgi:hypothetical protein